MDPRTWQPIPISSLPQELGSFEGWVLCGGHSVALLTGRDERSHGDTDIGVLRSQLVECLMVFHPDRVSLCQKGELVPWDGVDVPEEIHDIWIASDDLKHWVLQVMVFDDEGDTMIYRRDPRIRWPRAHHSVLAQGFRVLNPLVTFLFKANQSSLVDKDAQDLASMISNLSVSGSEPPH